MMRAHLAAVDGVDLAHLILDERVPALAHDGLAAEALGDLDRVPNEPRIVDDARAFVLLEEGFGKEADHVVALDEAALLVEEEAAVEVAVPRHAKVRARFAHDLRRRLAVLLQDGVRHAVREVAVRLVEYLYQLEWEQFLHRVDDGPRRAVACVDDDFIRLQLAHVDIGNDVLDVFVKNVYLLDFTRRGCRCGIGLADRHRRNVLQPRIARYGTGLRAHELHAVILLRVVARRDHDAAAEPEVRRCEVDHLRAALSEIHDVAARLDQSLCKRITDRRT